MGNWITNHCYVGDCREIMRGRIADGVKVQMCVTSPPYYGLRSYLDDDHEHKSLELGSERVHDCLGWATRDPCGECHVCRMVEVFGLVRELLADDGVLFLNYGDCYYNGDKGGYAKDRVKATDSLQRSNLGANFGGAPNRQPQAGLKPKDLMMMPARIALALQADGWWLRQDLIWSKPNPMPESVTDRCTKSHEYLFILSKRERYYFDQDAIREPASYNTHARTARARLEHESHPDERRNGIRSRPDVAGWAMAVMPDTRNKRSVWTIASEPFSEAHFAVFPQKLVEPCILAGTSQRGHCPECGKRWVRMVSAPTPPDDVYTDTRNPGDELVGRTSRRGGNGQKYQDWKSENPTQTLDWQPSCACNAEPVPDIVFDPFLGSGTTAMVAQRLGRHWLGCELSGDYVRMQLDRTRQAAMVLA